jgi:hypothetical protein
MPASAAESSRKKNGVMAHTFATITAGRRDRGVVEPRDRRANDAAASSSALTTPPFCRYM